MATASKSAETVEIVLTSDEVLVLFDWLARQNESDALPFDHSAEQCVLWGLEAVLETKLLMPFKLDYAELVEKARTAVVGN